MDLKYLEITQRNRKPLGLECRSWAAHPAAKWFLSELERLELEAVFRLENIQPENLAREQGVLKGLRLAINRLEEARKESEEDE